MEAASIPKDLVARMVKEGKLDVKYLDMLDVADLCEAFHKMPSEILEEDPLELERLKMILIGRAKRMEKEMKKEEWWRKRHGQSGRTDIHNTAGRVEA